MLMPQSTDSRAHVLDVKKREENSTRSTPAQAERERRVCSRGFLSTDRSAPLCRKKGRFSSGAAHVCLDVDENGYSADTALCSSLHSLFPVLLLLTHSGRTEGGASKSKGVGPVRMPLLSRKLRKNPPSRGQSKQNWCVHCHRASWVARLLISGRRTDSPKT